MMRVSFKCQRSTFFGIIAAEEEVEFAVAIVIEPDGGVGIYPGGKSGLFGHAGEMLAGVVMKELRLTPFVDEYVFVAIVIIVAPDRAGGYASAGLS